MQGDNQETDENNYGNNGDSLEPLPSCLEVLLKSAGAIASEDRAAGLGIPTYVVMICVALTAPENRRTEQKLIAAKGTCQ